MAVVIRRPGWVSSGSASPQDGVGPAPGRWCVALSGDGLSGAGGGFYDVVLRDCGLLVAAVALVELAVGLPWLVAASVMT